jgi:hypothetical protein
MSQSSNHSNLEPAQLMSSRPTPIWNEHPDLVEDDSVIRSAKDDHSGIKRKLWMWRRE